MNKPITLCDRCEEYARCCLSYDGANCRRRRTVKPTNADRIRSMTDEELADYLRYYSDSYARYDMDWLDWLRQEAALDGN